MVPCGNLAAGCEISHPHARVLHLNVAAAILRYRRWVVSRLARVGLTTFTRVKAPRAPETHLCLTNVAGDDG